MTSAQKLEHSVLSEINNGSLAGILSSLLLRLSGDQTPDSIEVHGRAVLRFTVEMEVSHTNLSEKSRMAKKMNDQEEDHTIYRKGYERDADLQPYHDH